MLCALWKHLLSVSLDCKSSRAGTTLHKILWERNCERGYLPWAFCKGSRNYRLIDQTWPLSGPQERDSISRQGPRSATFLFSILTNHPFSLLILKGRPIPSKTFPQSPLLFRSESHCFGKISSCISTHSGLSLIP